jgi:hypothetical protein
MGNPMIRFWTNPTRILRPGAGTGPASTLWEGKPRGWFEVSCYRIVAEPVILEISHDFPVLWIFFWIYIMRLCFFGRYRKATKQNEDSMVNKRGTISLSWIRMFVRTFPRHTKLGWYPDAAWHLALRTGCKAEIGSSTCDVLCGGNRWIPVMLVANRVLTWG